MYMGDEMSAYTAGMVEGQNKNNCGGMGWGGGEWIWILVVFALLFGWGGNGFGNGGGNGGGGVVPYIGGIATRADISEGFALNGIENGIRGIQQGICDSTYALNSGMMSGFSGVDKAICQNGYNMQMGFNGLQQAISDCCCKTQQSFGDMRYQMAADTCAIQNAIQNSTRDLIESNNAKTREIMGFMTQSKIEALQNENQALKFQASQSAQNAFFTANQEAQTAELIRRLGRDCPIPAYVVPNPNCCYGNPVGVSYGNGYNGYNGGCSSGCGGCVA